MAYILKESFDSPDIEVALIVYNHTAEVLDVNSQNYRKVIASTIATGKTCFASAFNCIGNILRMKGIVGTVFKYNWGLQLKASSKYNRRKGGRHL